LRQQGRPVPLELEAEVAQADVALFSKLREMLGLDQALAVNVGAAPTPVDVLEFFHALGIELAELWGMSETGGIGAVNRPGQIRIGTVGPAAPGVELKLADDGELLCRGEFLMAGYRNQPDQTAAAIDSDGWLHTGDIGELDEDGFLTIIDRKKELIINAAGKNMSPANIEAALKSGSPLIGQACCIGDRRPYNTALIVLDADTRPSGRSRTVSRAARSSSSPRSRRSWPPCRRGSTGPTSAWPAWSRSRSSRSCRETGFLAGTS